LERLCYECGDALRPRGYCEVCERWALAAPGEPCPKHDVDLLDRPPEPGFDPSAGRLVTVATFGLPAEAHGPRLRLEAEGIPAFLQGQRMGDHAIYGLATGGVKLQVPEEFADDARILLTQTWMPPKGDEPDPDDPWEGLGPDPAEHRRSVMKLTILLFLFGPLVFSLIRILLMMVGGRL
jgi:hypothetical protein